VVTDTLGGVIIADVDEFEPDQGWTQRDPSAPLVAELGGMDPGEVIRLRFRVITGGAGVLTNRARVSSNTVDPDTHNNEVVRSLDLGPAEPVRANLGVKLDPIRQEGGVARIQVLVRNDGPNAVSGALLRLNIRSNPQWFKIINRGPEAPSGPWIGPFSTQEQQTIQINAVLGVLAVNQQEVLSVSMEKGGRENTVVTAEARIGPPSGVTDPDTANNRYETSFDL
jgi:hypothetical protein